MTVVVVVVSVMVYGTHPNSLVASQTNEIIVTGSIMIIGLLTSGPLTSGPLTSGPVTSGPVTSGPVTSGPVPSGPVISPDGRLTVPGTEIGGSGKLACKCS